MCWLRHTVFRWKTSLVTDGDREVRNDEKDTRVHVKGNLGGEGGGGVCPVCFTETTHTPTHDVKKESSCTYMSTHH